MIDEVLACECSAKGVPEGYICGKPDCPRVLRAAAALEKLVSALFVGADDMVDEFDDAKVRPWSPR
jgi:hypothetical protein